MGKSILEVTDQTFTQEVEKSSGVVIVDFWAQWCAPCKAMEPVIEEVADEFTEGVRFAKINIDDNVDTPTRLGVMNIPTFILFKDGQESDRLVGFTSKRQLSDSIRKLLG